LETYNIIILETGSEIQSNVGQEICFWREHYDCWYTKWVFTKSIYCISTEICSFLYQHFCRWHLDGDWISPLLCRCLMMSGKVRKRWLVFLKVYISYNTVFIKSFVDEFQKIFWHQYILASYINKYIHTAYIHTYINIIRNTSSRRGTVTDAAL
jgi:hypothetical protein